MKKIFAMMLAALTLSVACTEEKALPSVSFESALPVVAGEQASFSIAISNYTGTEAVEIPVVVAGDAVEGEDYTISAKAFVVGGASPVTEITVTTLKFDTGKKVTLSLSAPAGWTLGKYATSEYVLSSKLGWVSFVGKKGGLSSKVDVKVGLYDAEGNPLKLENASEIEVAVDVENSTAVEGTHFKFSGEKTVTIELGESEGSISLEFLGEEVVADHDKIVLTLDPGEKFNLGTSGKMTLTILGSEWSRLDGEWKIAKMHSSKAWADQFWSTMLSGYDYIPVYDTNPDDDVLVDTNADDKLVFDIETLTLTPYFESSFKNYFIGVSNIEAAGEYGLRFNGFGTWNPNHPLWGGPLMTPAMKLDNTNRYFSATEQSQDKESIICYAVVKEGDDDILYIYLVDCESKTFFPEFWKPEELGFQVLGEEKPVLLYSGYPDVFMMASFKKVK
jgi:hypothetical protein